MRSREVNQIFVVLDQVALEILLRQRSVCELLDEGMIGVPLPEM